MSVIAHLVLFLFPHPSNQPTAPLHSFERSYQRLLEVERTNEANKAKMIQDCIRSGDKPEILKHNFYTNKFDTTGRYCCIIIVQQLPEL